ncbi:DinB family protein [Fulvivirgaceae bacterium BMA12]|uniref:DinB family protein n=1 Tax=Agaribacillus aureus TaxID=3051825 RepID=A0ABT8L7V3_9BACT|nr:DinB family protein [Fulvivirgaceae bacterium BMA12]
MITKPSDAEYPDFYSRYIALVPDGDVFKFLKKQKRMFTALIDSIPEDKLMYSYAEGKWTIKQVVGHVIDTERVMAYRALVFSRGERQAIPGFDENDYVEKASFNKKDIQDLIQEFVKLRESNMALIQNFSSDMMERKGNANDFLFSVRAIIYIIAGHVEHHINVIKNKYLCQ